MRKLVVICGPCASGKTSLGNQLERELGIPCVSKDSVKELLHDSLGSGDKAWSTKLGIASYSMLRHISDRFLLARVPFILESNFHPRGLTDFLAPLRTKYGAEVCIIDCSAVDDVLLERVQRRVESGERHPCHLDGASAEELRLPLHRDDPHALTDGDVLLRVDTTDFQSVDYAAISDVVRKFIGRNEYRSD